MDLPPPPELGKAGDTAAYRVEADVARDKINVARATDGKYNEALDAVKRVEEKIGKEEEWGKREAALLEKIQELENIRDVEGEDRFWQRRKRITENHLDDARVETEREREQREKFQHQVYLGEAVGTKMEYRIKEIELDNQRLRRVNELLRRDVQKTNQYLPFREYLVNLSALLNQHESSILSLTSEMEKLTILPTYWEEKVQEKSDIYCGKCNLRILEERKGSEYPVAMRTRDGGSFGNPLFKDEGQLVGYSHEPAVRGTDVVPQAGRPMPRTVSPTRVHSTILPSHSSYSGLRSNNLPVSHVVPTTVYHPQSRSMHPTPTSGAKMRYTDNGWVPA